MTIFIINMIRRSLQIELYNFTDFLNISNNITKQAFSKGRKKLLPMVFKLLNRKLILEIYSDNTIKTFKDYRILAIDGSTNRLPLSDELYEKFGTNKNDSIPLAQTSTLYDVLNHIAVDSIIDKYRSSEHELAIQHLDELNLLDLETKNTEFVDDIIIFDRGYFSLYLVFKLFVQKKHFVMRIAEHMCLKEIKNVINSGSKDEIITIYAFMLGRKVNPNLCKYLPDLPEDYNQKIRILTYELESGETEIILTSLLDQQSFTYSDIFKIYSMRWNIEENYKFYKSIMDIENFSGKTKISIEQDFYATIFTANYCSLLMEEAESELEDSKKNKYKINRNIAIGSFKNEILEILLYDMDLDDYCLKLKSRFKKNLVSIMPNRSFSRKRRWVKNVAKRKAL